MKEENKSTANKSLKKVEEIDNSDDKNLTTFTFTDPNALLKSMMTPRFLGSVHMKETLNSNNMNNVENLIHHKLDMKLKSAVYNPITLTLIFIALAFNILWLFFLLFA